LFCGKSCAKIPEVIILRRMMAMYKYVGYEGI
jgi:hypothetical protein